MSNLENASLFRRILPLFNESRIVARRDTLHGADASLTRQLILKFPGPHCPSASRVINHSFAASSIRSLLELTARVNVSLQFRRRGWLEISSFFLESVESYIGDEQNANSFGIMRLLFALTCLVLSFEQARARLATQKRDADFESVRTRLDRSYVKLEENRPQKYFHESTFHQHYDGRFADQPLKYDDKQAHLEWLMQAYLSVMEDLGVETWLMHGTLLGWYWNRKVMPWDSDIDVMISEGSIRFLANWYNMTVHRYTVKNHWFPRQYLLEINPNYSDNKIDQENRIDARWINMDNGLFIDITTLRRNRTSGGREAMMVKDDHHYSHDDIFPLRESTFVDVAVKVPFAYAEILVEEYGDEALAETKHENHRFDEIEGKWVPMAVTLNKNQEGLMTGG